MRESCKLNHIYTIDSIFFHSFQNSMNTLETKHARSYNLANWHIVPESNMTTGKHILTPGGK